jgi:hypothetical protein
MKNHFATYNQSLALKGFGFDEPCFRYIYTGDTGNNIDRYEEVEPSRAINFNHDSLCVSQPLKSQVFEWGRKNHSIHGIVSYYGKGQWNIEILDYKGNELIQIEDNTFWSYEEAESTCVDKLIELLQHDK